MFVLPHPANSSCIVLVSVIFRRNESGRSAGGPPATRGGSLSFLVVFAAVSSSTVAVVVIASLLLQKFMLVVHSDRPQQQQFMRVHFHYITKVMVFGNHQAENDVTNYCLLGVRSGRRRPMYGSNHNEPDPSSFNLIAHRGPDCHNTAHCHRSACKVPTLITPSSSSANDRCTIFRFYVISNL